MKLFKNFNSLFLGLACLLGSSNILRTATAQEKAMESTYNIIGNKFLNAHLSIDFNEIFSWAQNNPWTAILYLSCGAATIVAAEKLKNKVKETVNNLIQEKGDSALFVATPVLITLSYLKYKKFI